MGFIFYIIFLVDSLKKSSETIYFNKIVKIETLSESGTPTQSTPYPFITWRPFVFTSVQTNHSCDGKYTLFGRKQYPCLVSASSSLNLHQSQPHKARLIESEATTAPESVWRRTKRDNLKLLQCFSCFLWSIVNSLLSSSYPRVVFRLRASVFRPKTTGHRAASTRH